MLGVYVLSRAKIKGAPMSTVFTENALATVLVLTGVFFLIWGLVS
jgi:hypothetical protein